MERVSVGTGDRVGRYELEKILGEGGMAVVWRARHVGTDRSCALKLIKTHLQERADPSVDADARMYELFVREAKVGARIGKNPYIVEVFDAGIDERTGLPYIAMELLEGETIFERIVRAGPVAPDLVRVLVQQLGEALDQAHGAGVVHRDLKPTNLFLTQDRAGGPALKLVDFGISRLLEQGPPHTVTNVGTPMYAAPEQFGKSARALAAKQGVAIAGEISPQTDVWALGLVVFDLLTGTSANYWGVETMHELPIKIALEDPPVASSAAGDRAALLPPGFDAWFGRCLQRDATARFATAGAAVASLLAVLSGVDGVPWVPPAGGPNQIPAPKSTEIRSRPFVPPSSAAEPSTSAQPRAVVVRRTPSLTPWILALAGAVVLSILLTFWLVRGSRLLPRQSAKTSLAATGAPKKKPVVALVRMVRVPGGTIHLGEEGRQLATVGTFEIDQTEVTVAAYGACVEAGRCAEPRAGRSATLGFRLPGPGETTCNWGLQGRENHPINCVTWDQASAYCAVVGKRLPSHQEWELAAAGPEARRHAWGDTEPNDQLCWDRKDHATCPVGSFPRGDTPLGVKDMDGNVAEWTSSRATAGRGPGRPGPEYIARGSSWFDEPGSGPGKSGSADHDKALTNLGLRCARSASAAASAPSPP